jgi:hypothetical protein
MPSWKKPTPETVDRATSLLVHGQQRAHFFENLKLITRKTWSPSDFGIRSDSIIHISAASTTGLPANDLVDCPKQIRSLYTTG